MQSYGAVPDAAEEQPPEGGRAGAAKKMMLVALVVLAGSAYGYSRGSNPRGGMMTGYPWVRTKPTWPHQTQRFEVVPGETLRRRSGGRTLMMMDQMPAMGHANNMLGGGPSLPMEQLPNMVDQSSNNGMGGFAPPSQPPPGEALMNGVQVHQPTGADFKGSGAPVGFRKPSDSAPAEALSNGVHVGVPADQRLASARKDKDTGAQQSLQPAASGNPYGPPVAAVGTSSTAA